MKDRLFSLLGTVGLVVALTVVALPVSNALAWPSGGGGGGATGKCDTDTLGGYTNCAGQGTCTGTCSLDRSSTTGGCPCK
jgi:uncharacterized membrane protein